MGPPSSGGVHIVQILNAISGHDLKKWGPHHPKSVHVTASAMQQAFADRSRYLGDPDFVNVPIAQLTSKEYGSRSPASVVTEKALTKEEVMPGKFPDFKESDQTTHFSIVDREGNIVSTTQTINGWFGSGVVVPDTGVILNNEMDDFTTVVGGSNLFGAIGGKKNIVLPKKRPLSSMSPTIVLKDGKASLALGSPSGTRILTCVLLTLVNVLEHDMPLYDAISATRYHHQWSPDEIRVESSRLPASTEDTLASYGHNLKHKDYSCSVQAVQMKKDQLIGVADPRGQGLALGR